MAYQGEYRDHGAAVASEREARRMLGILELEELADLPSLDRQFKRLIKLYHPDLNPGAQAWANDRSQAVIEATRVLRDYIERIGPLSRIGASLYSRRNVSTAPVDRTAGAAASAASARSATEGASGPAAGERPRRPPQWAFQLIDGPRLNYALPIQHIVKIIGVRDPCVHRGSGGPCCSLGGELYPLHNLEGQDLPWDAAAFIVLLRSPTVRVGIVLPRDARFGGIESFRARDVLGPTASRSAHGVWIRKDMKFYLCPADFVSDSAARPVYS